ncbi:hypothetical protein NQ317_014155 [Molorchus minor]|uniref:Uncharacterized protein n=1 Tax=Molorchus minor TaxID=1323400 RepID=A0ABQ9J262_9CUCU|nr:hypothetical protein NQ317_014155 [Molorchus minor]
MARPYHRHGASDEEAREDKVEGDKPVSDLLSVQGLFDRRHHHIRVFAFLLSVLHHQIPPGQQLLSGMRGDNQQGEAQSEVSMRRNLGRGFVRTP